MIVDQINRYLTENGKEINDYIAKEVGKQVSHSFKRQFQDPYESSNKLRISEAGKCPRQLAYKYHEYPEAGKEIDSRGKIVFYYGDILEASVIGLAKLSGCQLVGTGHNQITLSKEIGTEVINGHPDGVVLHNGEMALLEIKSMTTFTHLRFTKGEIDESYIAQVQLYMDLLNLNKCCFVGINKDSGVLHEMILERDKELVARLWDILAQIIQSSKETLLNRKYVAVKGFYPWQCVYCRYHKHCLPNAEKVVVSGRYKLKEKK